MEARTAGATFYEKHGWRRIGNRIHRLQIADRPFPLEVWRYEKDLSGPAGHVLTVFSSHASGKPA